MKLFKRAVAAVLALMMASSVMIGAVSCAKNPDGPSSDTGDTAASTSGNTQTPGETTGGTLESGHDTEGDSAADTTPGVTYDSLEKKKFDREFVICTRKDHLEDMEIEGGYTGNILNDAIIDRNTTVSEDYGIEFLCVTPNGEYRAALEEMVTQATSGVDDYDLFIGHKDSFTMCAQNGYCMDLLSIDTLDLSNPWWDKGCYENLKINDKVYMMTGDINPATMRFRSCMAFNKDLMTDLTLSTSELNTLAKEGKWTLDALATYTANITRDLNGDGAINYTDDRYGLVGWRTAMPYDFYYGAGSPFITVVDGTPELTYANGGTDKLIDIYEKIYKITYDQNAYFVTEPGLYTTYYEVFRDGRGLFCDIALYDLTLYVANAGMDDEYGILPTPKYDEQQENYQSFVNGAASFVLVATSEKDPAYVGTIIEAMGAYNYENITPNMYEIVTKLQVAQDPDSAQMISLILRTAVYDMAYYANFSISDLFCSNLMEKKASISSSLAAGMTKAQQRELPNLLKAFDKEN